MPEANVSDEQAYRALIASGSRIVEGSRILAGRLPVLYHSEDPLHRAASEAEALRSGLHVIVVEYPELGSVVELFDRAADELSGIAEAAGV